MKNWILFGWYQMLGGGWGLIILLKELVINDVNLQQIIIATFFIALFILIIFSGLLTLRQNVHRKKIVMPSLIIQVIQFHFGGFGFAFVAGSYLGIELASETSFFFRPLYGNFLLSFEASESDFLSINIIPVVLLFFVDKLLGNSNPPHDGKD